MTTAQTGRRPGRVVARSLGCGACSGAMFGILTLAVILFAAGLATGYPGDLGAIFILGPYAAVVGSVIGAACGVLASVPVLLVGDADRRSAGRSSRARRDRASLAAGGGAALLPAVLGAWEAARGSGGWAAYLCVSGMAALGGMALGPCVRYGRRGRVRSARTRAQSGRAGHPGQPAAG